MKRFALAIVALAVVGFTATTALAGGHGSHDKNDKRGGKANIQLAVHNGAGVPILDVKHGHRGHQDRHGYHRDRNHHGHHGYHDYRPYRPRPVVVVPYAGYPTVVVPRIYPPYPYYGPQYNFQYHGRGVSVGIGF